MEIQKFRFITVERLPLHDFLFINYILFIAIVWFDPWRSLVLYLFVFFFLSWILFGNWSRKLEYLAWTGALNQSDYHHLWSWRTKHKNQHHGIKISLSLWIKSWSQRLLPAVVFVLNTSASPTCRHSGATLLVN